MDARPIPLNFFSIPFGLAGLAESWDTAARLGSVPVQVAEAFAALCALVWLLVIGFYLRYVISHRGAFRSDMVNPVASPFASLVIITPTLLTGLILAPHALLAARIVGDILIAATAVVGAWYTGQWIYGPLALDRFHPGYFLPTVAGGLVASATAAAIKQIRLAEVMLGFGVICWFLLGSMILARLFFRPFLPAAIVPTLAIEVAPAAVASVAYFAINGDRVDVIAALLAGYGALMALAQIRLLPAYLKLTFAVSFWAFTFSWAAVASTGLVWVDSTRFHEAWTYLILSLITLFVGAIAVRTVMALIRRQLLPPTPPSGPPPPSAAAATT